MIIFVDGYNVMKLFFSGRGEDFYTEKRLFIKSIGAYLYEKKASITEQIVFFDGGGSAHMMREVKNNVVVMHAGIRMSADDAMVEAVKRYRNKELVVVTNDRTLIARIHAVCPRTVFMESEVFWELVCKTINQSKVNNKKNILSNDGPKKIVQHDVVDEGSRFADIDLLMSMASVVIPEKNEIDEKKATMKKGEKKDILQKVIKKL
jgi:hypothetical protein